MKKNEFIIKNANLIDGSGSIPRISHIYVKDGKILRISQNEKDEIFRNSVYTFNADGLYLSPGFIDPHGHSDISILAAPEAEGKISQGITSEISGNCGLSVFPITDKNREHLERLYKNYDIKLNWSSIDEYAEKVDSASPAINIGSLLGHNTVRAAVCGYEKKEMSRANLAEMKKILKEEISIGALGFSSGLLYVPGIFSPPEELLELLKEFANFAKPYTSHLRSEGDGLLEAIEEAIELCTLSGCPKLHISHFKTAGKKNWHKLDDALKIIENTSAKITITADRYPYTESMTNLSAYLPKFFREMDDLQISKFLSTSDGLIKGMAVLSELREEFWTSMRLVSSSIPKYHSCLGKKFDEIAKIAKRQPAEICLDLLKDAPSAIAASGGMSEENMKKIISLPYVACCTDESVRNRDYNLGRSHPRGFASFPRFIKLALKDMPIEQVIRKITSLPAQIFGLKDRGLIKETYFADIVLFDLERLKDLANFAEPHQISKGIEKVWVNGVLSWDADNSTGKRAGKFLKS